MESILQKFYSSGIQNDTTNYSTLNNPTPNYKNDLIKLRNDSSVLYI